MNNGLKLFWLTGLVCGIGVFGLQGCGDDGGTEDGGAGGSAGSSGGSGGSSSGGKSGSAGSGGSSSSSGGNGGTSSSGGSGGSSQAGDGPGAGGDGPGAGGDGPGAGGDGPGAGGDGPGNDPSPACLEFCTGDDSISEHCGDDDRFPEEWEGDGCLTACASFDEDAFGCWQLHLNNIAGGESPQAHCGHAVGAPDNAVCDERE